MEKQDVLKLCMDNGFFLDRGMLDFFIENENVEEIISKLKNLNVSEKILTKDVFEKYRGKLNCSFDNCSEKENSVEILKDIKTNSGKIESRDFVSYFRARFDVLKDVLIKRGDLENLSSIRRIGLDNGIFCVVGMVFDKHITKNKNLLIEVEDLTGRTIVLINRENKELFERARSLLLDDVVAFKCSGSSKMLFASDFIYPDACLNSEKFGNKDEFVAFSGDFHVGSKMFLEGNLMRFVEWLNGSVGDERQKSLARKVKHLILSGDNIEGVGVYPGQEKFLNIKGCRDQYDKLAEILNKIRKDVEIIMCPGQHDAVWVGEPQPSILEKWGGSLNKMKNLKLISNPSLIEIGGLKIMIYHGSNLNKLIDEIPELRSLILNKSNFSGLDSVGQNSYIIGAVKEVLKRRHLAPVYGEMDIIPNKIEDDLVLGDLPDIFVIGGQHRAMVGSYNNILIVSSSCWQSRTDFEEKVGNEPDPCRVPILNLKSKEIKILDFSDDTIKWEEGKDLVCDINGGGK